MAHKVLGVDQNRNALYTVESNIQSERKAEDIAHNERKSVQDDPDSPDDLAGFVIVEE